MKRNWYNMVSQIQVNRCDPMPVEYILGGSFFCGEWFIITPDVLIPRQETETLVEYTIKKSETTRRGTRISGSGYPDLKSEFKVLDLGTGCGNIAITLAKKLNCKVYAIDISLKALGVAKRNTKLHGVEDRIEFYKSNWYNELDIEPVDIIVSNPPYIAEEEWERLPEEVKNYEPQIALKAGKDGLDHYKRIISGAKKMLVSGGRIVLEIGYNQAEAIKKLLDGFRDIEVIKDCYSNNRVVSAIWIN